MTVSPASSVRALLGVGPVVARALARAGITTVRDLLWYLPFRYEDRARLTSIGSLGSASGAVTVTGRIVDLVARRARARRLHLVEALVDDGTGAISVIWFNQPYLAETLRAGQQLWLHGPLRPAPRRHGMQLVSPEWEVDEAEDDGAPLHVGRIVPVYRRLGTLGTRRIRALQARALDAVGDLDDPLVRWLPPEMGLPRLSAALLEVHFPEAGAGDQLTDRRLDELARHLSPGHRRMAFEELLGLAVVLERERLRRAHRRAMPVVITDEIRETARRVLPFRLTTAQRRVLAEIVQDLQRPYPMARLLQGDVGSGKTIVAALSALVTVECGAQAAVLAPTELLAQQHQATLCGLLAASRHRPELLVGSLGEAEKRRVHRRLASGEATLVVGTHALIEDAVAFNHLGLAVIDEQHRFGVSQRQALLNKGTAPHLLVMTATPIPRSLALTLYGDLDVSVLDELPPGRTAVRTVVRDEGARGRLLDFVRREVAQGGQVYWVFALIEDSESISARAVASHERAVRAALPGVRVGTVHGRMTADEREAVMAAFVAGEVGVLCATTVIEVGVDVANASVMIVENAERFGLAQLHQLRGRVGRGRRRSFCVLLAGADCPPEARRRLDLLASTADGFRIAEEDFRMRGPGELTGLRQWGRPELRVASLWTHRRELQAARELAHASARAGTLADLASALGLEDDRTVPSA